VTEQDKIRESDLIRDFRAIYKDFKVIVIIHDDSSVSQLYPEKLLLRGTSETGIVKVNVRTAQVDIGF